MRKDVSFDFGFSKEEAASLRLKSYFFICLQEIIRNSEYTQTEISQILETDQPVVSRILKGRIDLLSIERISDYLQRLGYDIHIGMEACAPGTRGTVIFEGFDRKELNLA
jgi:predicted XRE-type DNA-binding protein